MSKSKSKQAAASPAKPARPPDNQPHPPASPSPLVTRGLSVCEPWAWAIVAGADPLVGRGWKPIENRTWSTEFRGTVAIQASTAKHHLTEDNLAFIFGADSRIVPLWDRPAIEPDNPIVHRGAFVGCVDIVGCVAHRRSQGAAHFERAVRAAGLAWWLDKYQGDFDGAGWAPEVNGETWSSDAVYWADGEFCWLLDNARQFSQPIPGKGRLNIFHLTPEEIAAVARALRAPLGCPVEYRAGIEAAKRNAMSLVAGKGSKAAAG